MERPDKEIQLLRIKEDRKGEKVEFLSFIADGSGSFFPMRPMHLEKHGEERKDIMR